MRRFFTAQRAGGIPPASETDEQDADAHHPERVLFDVRQLSFECGYSLASLRERLYAASPGAGTPMAGILVYTSAGDAEGSLGGLVREAQVDRLLPTIRQR